MPGTGTALTRTATEITDVKADASQPDCGLRLADGGLTLAVAESCTGGMLAAAVTDVAGCSAYFKGGIVAYCNTVKTDLLGVDAELLKTDGAVSNPVAAAMAEGALQRFGADLALSTTGIAGPGGGSSAKPVGLVYIALAARNAATAVQECRFTGSRREIRTAAVSAALNMLAAAL